MRRPTAIGRRRPPVRLIGGGSDLSVGRRIRGLWPPEHYHSHTIFRHCIWYPSVCTVTMG